MAFWYFRCVQFENTSFYPLGASWFANIETHKEFIHTRKNNQKKYVS